MRFIAALFLFSLLFSMGCVYKIKDEGDKKEDCFCTLQYDPVCGNDGKTYSNSCFAQCEGVEIAYKGECR